MNLQQKSRLFQLKIVLLSIKEVQRQIVLYDEV